MFWTANQVKYRLRYWQDFHGYVADYRPIIEMVGIPKRRRSSFEPRFVFQAMDNAMFEEAREQLNEQERDFLEALYTDGSEDFSVQIGEEFIIKISVKPDAFDSLVAKTGMKPREVGKIASEAIKKMVEYLNELEGK